MAGLLDFLNTDQGLMGLGLLGAAAPSMAPMNFAGRLAQAGQNIQGMQQQQQQKKMMDMQMANYQSEIEARKLAAVKDARQQALIASMFGGGGGGSGAGDPEPTAPAGAAPGGVGQASGGAPNIMQLARQLGIPEQVVQADFVLNGGKGIADMLYKRGVPDVQISNGFAYDKNRVQPGYMPQLSISTDGKATQVQVGPDGQPIVSAPKGAPETYGTYQGIEAGIKAANTPMQVYNPTTQRLEFAPQSRVLGGQKHPDESGLRAAVAGDMGADIGALRREIQAVKNDLMKPNDEPSRKLLRDQLASLQAQESQLSKQSMGGVAAGPSASETAAADAERVKAVDTAKADVVRDTSRQQGGKLQGQLLAGLDVAESLLKEGPTASGLGATVDSISNYFGRSSTSAEAASKLETVSGWLTSNVPRMEGPQSDKDVATYRQMAAEVGDKTKPVAQRISAVQELRKLQAKYAELNASDAPAGATAPAIKPAYRFENGKLVKVP